MKNKKDLHVVSFSGGKDSTAMLLRMVEEGFPIDIILYCDTGLEFPEMYEHIKKVELYIQRPITILKSEKDFMYWATEHERIIESNKIPGVQPGEVMRGRGWPGLFNRWCSKELKINTIRRFLRPLKKEYNIIQYLGIAEDEPDRLKEKNRYPLVEWGMTEKDCLKYCYERGFDWGGLYEIWDRVSCWCCPLQSLEDLRKLRKFRPELWNKLKKIDKKINELDERNCINFQLTRSLKDVEQRFELEEEFLAQGKSIRKKEFFQTLKDRGINYSSHYNKK